MPASSEAITALLLAAPPRAGRTRVLAIDGRSGAGKTVLAQRLGVELGAPVVSMDYLYDGWDGLDRGIARLVSEVLKPIAAGRVARVPRYDWTAGGWGTPWELAPPDILLVDGVGAGAEAAARYESTVIWLEAPRTVREKRALDRDGDDFAPHWDQWAAQEDVMLARERTPERADLIVQT